MTAVFSLRIDDELSVRLLEARHAERLFALIDENRDHLARWFPWVQRTTSVEHTREFLRRSLAKFADGNGFEAGVFFRGEQVGMIGLHYLNWETRATEIGYWLAARHQGAGLMTRVVRGLCRVLFEDMALERVEIRTDPENVRSRRIPERLGFTQEGVLRRVARHGDRPFDHVVYGLLADEYRARAQEWRAQQSSVERDERPPFPMPELQETR